MGNNLMFWPSQVNDLVKALEAHEKTISVDIEHFRNILLPYTVTWDDFAYHPIKAENNIPQEDGNNSLVIDGIIYNSVAESFFIKSKESRFFKPFYREHPIEKKKTFWQKILPDQPQKPPVYSIDKILKDLNNEDMVRIMMSHPPTPHTLLCRLNVITYHNDGVTIQTRPVLVRPGISPEDEQKVYRWEIDHIKTERKEDY
jgi:hypothetical protein